MRMACRHTEIQNLKEDRDKINLAIEKLVAAKGKSDFIGEQCACIDTKNKDTFRTINMQRLQNKLLQLNEDGNEAIETTITGLNNGLAELEVLLLAYELEDRIYHATNPDEPIPGESEESA